MVVLFGAFLLWALIAYHTDETGNTTQSQPTLIDPRVEAFVRQRPRCPNAEYSYAWICGSIVRMPGPHYSQVCTTKEEPFFAGSLSLPDQRPFYSMAIRLSYGLPLEPLVPCSENRPNSTHHCASITLYPQTTTEFGVFREQPPYPLPADFPKYPFESKGHTLAPNYFADFDGSPVALFYTRWIGKKRGAAPDQCLLLTRIDWLNIGVELDLPCEKMGQWRSELGRTIEAIEGGIVLSDSSAACDIPPDGTIFLINRYNQSTLKGLAKWLELYR